MAIQSTPHTESQQNKNEAQTELDPNQIAERLERDGEAGLYANTDGAQTGMNRAEHVTSGNGPKLKVEPATSAYTGSTSADVSSGEAQGISNHSQSSEHDGQVKVMAAREKAEDSSGEEARSGQPERDAVEQNGDLPGRGSAKGETVDISSGRAIR